MLCILESCLTVIIRGIDLLERIYNQMIRCANYLVESVLVSLCKLNERGVERERKGWGGGGGYIFIIFFLAL